MPARLRLDRDDLDALADWLSAQLPVDRAGRAHAAILKAITPHLHQHTSAGQLARHTLMLLGTIYDDQPGYRDEWRP